MTANTPESRTRGPVVDLSHSPHTTLHPVPLGAVTLQDRFWKPRIDRNREVTLPAQLQQCEQTGRIDNFRRASGKKQIPFQGIFFNDSDVYKWAEAAAYSLATHPDPKLDADLDAVIAEIAAAQQPDGYLNTYYMFEREAERFSNLKDMHEIYCAGHLFQAAVAHHRATGKTSLLDVACRLADCLFNHFGPGKRVGACGHEEAEMALVELYRTTHDARYLELAHAMIEARGREPGIFGKSAYHQDHLPFTEQTEFVGHAVRHLYLVCGATDLIAERDLPGYRQALDTLWNNLTRQKMYVTGGAGSRWEGESFGANYELPNDRAYTETCAAIGSMMWNWRMLNITGEAKYADLMEHTLYNAVLPGLSLDGLHYFYQNPLADRGKHRRQEWFGCACCPPNIARLLASLSGYFYSVDAEGAYLHLYASSTATLSLPNGVNLTLTQQAEFPWSGNVEIQVGLSGADTASLHLRIPAWAKGATVEVDGQHLPTSEIQPGTYVSVTVRDGSEIYVTLPMEIERLQSHPFVQGNLGREAVRRGPLIYCLEQVDHPTTDVWNIAFDWKSGLSVLFVPDLLDGVIVLRGQAQDTTSARWENTLYSPVLDLMETKPDKTITVPITAIPYYAWANRDPGPMQVWIPTLPGNPFE